MIWKILMSVFSDVLSMKDRGQLQWKSLGISCQSLFNERQGGEEREMVSKLGGRTSTFNIYSEDLCSIASVADSSQRLACHCFEIAGLPRRTYFWTLPVAVLAARVRSEFSVAPRSAPDNHERNCAARFPSRSRLFLRRQMRGAPRPALVRHSYDCHLLNGWMSQQGAFDFHRRNIFAT